MRAPTETVKMELGSPLTVYQLLSEEVVRHKLNIHRGLLQTLSIIGGKFCSTRRPAMLGCASWRLAASWPVFLPTSTKRRAPGSQFAVEYKDTGHSKQLMPLTESLPPALACIQRKFLGLLNICRTIFRIVYYEHRRNGDYPLAVGSSRKHQLHACTAVALLQ